MSRAVIRPAAAEDDEPTWADIFAALPPALRRALIARLCAAWSAIPVGAPELSLSEARTTLLDEPDHLVRVLRRRYFPSPAYRPVAAAKAIARLLAAAAVRHARAARAQEEGFTLAQRPVEPRGAPALGHIRLIVDRIVEIDGGQALSMKSITRILTGIRTPISTGS